VFTLGLFSGGISLILITATSNKYTIAILMVLYGVSWATLTICPYDIFAKIIPKKNNGYYMGIINMAVVIPQIVTGLFLGPLYKFVFSQQASKIILMAGFLLMVSALLSMRRQFNKATTHEAYIIADT
jgi:maltose/moltooligosaccharide transporter